MADEKAVPRAELAKLLGLPPDSSDAELQKAMADLVAHQKAAEAESVAAPAEQGLQAEDKRIVAAAINAGKLPANRASFWIDACKRDRARNRAVIAMISPSAWVPERVAVDSEMERVHNKVMASLGYEPTVTGGGAAPPPPAPAGRYDAHGFPVANVPSPVVLQKRATDPADWTWQQRSDFFQRNILGGKFKEGTKPPPPLGDVIYWPSPSDTASFDEATGEWVEKNPYREI